jgi:hypothetical protein
MRGSREPESLQTVGNALAAPFEGGFSQDRPEGMEGLLEQDQGSIFLPGQVFRRREKHALPGYFKATAVDKFIQRRLSINIKIPMKLFINGLHVTSAAEVAVKLLAEADWVNALQIPPAQTAGQFPQNALQEEAICRQRLAAAVFARGVDLGVQNIKSFLQEQPLGVGETV